MLLGRETIEEWPGKALMSQPFHLTNREKWWPAITELTKATLLDQLFLYQFGQNTKHNTNMIEIINDQMYQSNI